MDVSRKILKNVSKRTTNVAKSAYGFGERSVQGHVVEGVILVILIVFTAVVLKFLPSNFLCWFNHIVVKIIFLIVIAFVALYSPAVGLMLAILLVSLIQMCQKKQLSQEIDVLKQVPMQAQAPVMPEPATTSDTVDPDRFLKDLLGADTSGIPYGGGRAEKGAFKVPLGPFARCGDRELLWRMVQRTIEDLFLNKIGSAGD